MRTVQESAEIIKARGDVLFVYACSQGINGRLAVPIEAFGDGEDDGGGGHQWEAEARHKFEEHAVVCRKQCSSPQGAAHAVAEYYTGTTKVVCSRCGRPRPATIKDTSRHRDTHRSTVSLLRRNWCTICKDVTEAAWKEYEDVCHREHVAWHKECRALDKVRDEGHKIKDESRAEFERKTQTKGETS